MRELTHTLHLPPAHAELYGGPHSDWLRDCLERLPRLQSLIVNGLPFFDHSSLITLRHSSLWWRTTHINSFPVFGLRLLDASGCTNATSTGLSEALAHFPDLVSLDLSRTPAAKDGAVFNQLRSLMNLRILGLRGLGLKDSELGTIAAAIGTRVRSLDVRQNNLTDSSARALLEHCIRKTGIENHALGTSLSSTEYTRSLEELDFLSIEDLGALVRRRLTQSLIGSLTAEKVNDVGVTHLYLSGNAMTVEGISGLLRPGQLQALDTGTLATALKYEENKDRISLPSVAKLIPVLAKYAPAKLIYLRVDHALITQNAPTVSIAPPRAELEVDAEVYLTPNTHELEAREPSRPELDSLDTAVYEFPGDSIQPNELPGSSPLNKMNIQPTNADSSSRLTQGPSIQIRQELQDVNRGPGFAPELITGNSLLSPTSPIIDATGSLSPTGSTFQEKIGSRSTGDPGTDHSSIRRESSHYVQDRKARLELRQSQENRLHPGMLPKVRTIILTNVPIRTSDWQITHRIISFIKDCAEEASIAKARARHSYMLPPGRTRAVAVREYARSLFGMERIVLEMAPPESPLKKISTSWRQYPTKSSTEDKDSEAFWDAAAHDFSFFDDEECGLPNAENQLPLSVMSGLMVAPKQLTSIPKPTQSETTAGPTFDVVAGIAKFRKERKAAYQTAVQLGESEPDIEGYWAGAVTIVRKVVDANTDSVDYYGNRSGSG
jgi:hypothetical protein